LASATPARNDAAAVQTLEQDPGEVEERGRPPPTQAPPGLGPEPRPEPTPPAENGAPPGAVSDSGAADAPPTGDQTNNATATATASNAAAQTWPEGDLIKPQDAARLLAEAAKWVGPRALAASPLATLILALTSKRIGGEPRSALMFDGRLRITVPHDDLHGTVELLRPDGTWEQLPNPRRFQAMIGPDGTPSIDLNALRAELGADRIGQLPGFPEEPEKKPEPLITVSVPPVPLIERYPIFTDLDLPNHTGRPPEVVRLPDMVTPIPEDNPNDWILKSVSGKEFSQGKGVWQGAAISHEQAIKKFGEEAAQVEKAWHQAVRAVKYNGTAASGTRAHSDAEARINDLKIKNMETEVSIEPSGDRTDARSKGTVRLDVYQLKNNDTLMIYDFKAGNAKLTESRISQIVNRVSRTKDVTIKSIVVLQVK
jgi:hypothetical protein